MIISKTPFRISFFGGGTDYPDYFRANGGEVLSTSINKYCYISTRTLPPFFEHKFRVAYSRIEMTSSVEEIEHPSVRNVLKWLNVEAGTEIQHIGDLPARSGIGSSSSFTVGLLNALNAQQGRYIGKEQLADPRHSCRTGSDRGAGRITRPDRGRLWWPEPYRISDRRLFQGVANHRQGRFAQPSGIQPNDVFYWRHQDVERLFLGKDQEYFAP